MALPRYRADAERLPHGTVLTERPLQQRPRRQHVDAEFGVRALVPSRSGLQIHDVRQAAVVAGGRAAHVQHGRAQHVRVQRVDQATNVERRVNGSAVQQDQLQIGGSATYVKHVGRIDRLVPRYLAGGFREPELRHTGRALQHAYRRRAQLRRRHRRRVGRSGAAQLAHALRGQRHQPQRTELQLEVQDVLFAPREQHLRLVRRVVDVGRPHQPAAWRHTVHHVHTETVGYGEDLLARCREDFHECLAQGGAVFLTPHLSPHRGRRGNEHRGGTLRRPRCLLGYGRDGGDGDEENDEKPEHE
jgi:hypothetical protein